MFISGGQQFQQYQQSDRRTHNEALLCAHIFDDK
jgi:hypothetical protein